MRHDLVQVLLRVGQCRLQMHQSGRLLSVTISRATERTCASHVRSRWCASSRVALAPPSARSSALDGVSGQCSTLAEGRTWPLAAHRRRAEVELAVRHRVGGGRGRPRQRRREEERAIRGREVQDEGIGRQSRRVLGILCPRVSRAGGVGGARTSGGIGCRSLRSRSYSQMTFHSLSGGGGDAPSRSLPLRLAEGCASRSSTVRPHRAMTTLLELESPRSAKAALASDTSNAGFVLGR